MSNLKKNISVTEASRNFADYINRVVYRGESFVLIRGNKAVAEISPVVSGKCLKELSEIFEKFRTYQKMKILVKICLKSEET